ncbi:MAG TPA: hypothetical protein VJZ76_09865 [Thermoanaerobaculia bacterium]|nr:hypothetical protein [Thermoanaerobaculia bacterium]
MRALAMLLLVAATASAATSPIRPTTTNNDDSCDLALQPAATLLLPYFEVDFRSSPAQARTTVLTIVNTSPLPQIANVTLWTDWSFPAFSFPIFLTGYGVQGINLYDVFARGVIAPTACAGAIPPTLLQDLQTMFTTGRGTACPATPVGSVHANAIGYATIDVVAECAAKNAASPDYFTTMLLFDNVLTGDSFDYLGESQGSAVGGPLVHIRAVPEGGAAGSVAESKLPVTFYSRVNGGRTIDRRQPLPSSVAARFLDDEASGFRTTFHIWRETLVPSGGPCAGFAANGAVPLAEAVRFDEHENATIVPAACAFCFRNAGTTSASAVASSSPLFPSKSTSGDAAGWLRLDLDGQGWVTSKMQAPPHYSVDVAATALGNGCARGAAKIDDSCDIALQPAATLLLPYFDVDVAAPQPAAATTLFTVTNVSPRPHIANVTLWTDWGYPALNFPLFLTGYDAQSINLYDVLAHGNIVSGDGHCGPRPLSKELLLDLQLIFTHGKSTGAATSSPATISRSGRGRSRRAARSCTSGPYPREGRPGRSSPRASRTPSTTATPPDCRAARSTAGSRFRRRSRRGGSPPRRSIPISSSGAKGSPRAHAPARRGRARIPTWPTVRSSASTSTRTPRSGAFRRPVPHSHLLARPAPPAWRSCRHRTTTFCRRCRAPATPADGST